MKKEGKEQVHERQAGRIEAQSQTTAPPALMSSLFAIRESRTCQTVCKAKFAEKVFASFHYAKTFSANLAERRNFAKTDFNGIEITTENRRKLKIAEKLKSQKN